MKKNKRLIIVIMILILNVRFFSYSGFAWYQEFSDWGIKRYIPNNCVSGGGVYTGDIQVYGDTALEKVWNGMTSAGLSPEQAAGIMGNLRSESGMSPTRHEGKYVGKEDPRTSKKSYGIGLAQWSGGRRISLIEKLDEANVYYPYIDDWQTFNLRGEELVELSKTNPNLISDEDINVLIAVQLEMLFDELSTRGGRANYDPFGEVYDKKESELATILAMSSEKDVAAFFRWSFEVPGSSSRIENGGSVEKNEKSRSERQNAASEILETGRSFSGGGSGAYGSGSNCGGANAKFTEYVLKYAWPEYRGPPKSDYARTQKPEYYEAVRGPGPFGRGRRAGGDGGNDCGGFVTILVQDSELDVDYNACGKSMTWCGGTSTQLAQVQKRSDEWTPVNGDGGPVNVDDLLPGDVAYIKRNCEGPTCGHTFIYVGEIDGFESNIASASYYSRSPMAGKEDLVYDKSSSGTTVVLWYRKIQK